MATAVSVTVLVAVLVLVAWGRVADVVVALPAALGVVAFGLVSVPDALDTLDRLGPTLVFLAAILVIGEVARGAGLFDSLGHLLVRRGRRSAGRLLVGVSVGAVAVTAVMSLDATAVLFTPIVLHVVRGVAAGRQRDQPLLATAQLANASSGLLPVSNLTNLIVFSSTGLTFGGFALRMALPTAVASSVVVAVALRRTTRSEPAPATNRVASESSSGASPPAPAPASAPAPYLDEIDGFARFVLAALVVLVVGFFVASEAGVEPAWVAAVVAAVLAGAAVARRRADARQLLVAASPRFLMFVAALAVVVEAAVGQGLDDLARDLLPVGASLAALLAIALISAVTANLVNNVPATLLLLAAIGTTGPATAPRLLALLVGVNIGPNLTYTGSLATLLWRRVVRSAGAEPSHREFFRFAALATPPALVLATVALWLTVQVVG